MTTSTSNKPLKRLSLLQTQSSPASPSLSSFNSSEVASKHRVAPDVAVMGPSSTVTAAQASPFSFPLSPTASAPTGSGSKNARRHSSIYYVSPDRELERISRGSGSPVNARRFSALQTPSENARTIESIKRDRRSVDLTDTPSPPLTLAERHADLLRFIAQKESKCLELRSQLAAQEAELLVLKRKWERIVSRGGPSASVPFTPGTVLDADASPQAAVFSGIKGGVQGVGRLLAHFGDTSTQVPDSDPGHGSNSSVSTTLTSSSLRLSQSSISSLGGPDEGFGEREEPVAEAKSGHRLSNSISTASAPPSSSKLPMQSKHQKRLSTASGAFPPPSSIPAMNVGAPLAAWVDSVGKKFGQLQAGTGGAGAHPIHKRASTLLSDASHSLFAALTSPTRTSPAGDHAQLVPSPTSLTTSLLDDDDALGDGSGVQWAGMAALSPERPKIVPIRAVPASASASHSLAKQQDGSVKGTDSESEEWNW
ncbi:hypothetical protein DFH11DRAFT_1542917 [Phellopilus nigrolimitatus]|nr:hypothetical protein DFH11DRAFT_1542917 [Phellopilus nigrolimitatus]